MSGLLTRISLSAGLTFAVAVAGLLPFAARGQSAAAASGPPHHVAVAIGTHVVEVARGTRTVESEALLRWSKLPPRLPSVPPGTRTRASGPSKSTPPHSLPAVVVTATRAPVPAFDVPASISVVTSAEIRPGPPGTALAQTLARVPGVVAQTRQSLAQDLQLSIRGYGARASFGVRGVRLMVDGLPYSLPGGQGQTDPFDLAATQRIEVLRGPFKVMYGNAAGGVIQLFTKNGPERPEVGMHVAYGSYGARIERLEAGGTVGKVNYMANLSRFRTDGYRAHSAAQRKHFYGKVRYRPNENASLTFILNAENQPFAQDPSALTAAQAGAHPRTARSAVFTFGAGEFHRHRQGGVVYKQQLGAHDRLHATAWAGRRRVVQYLPFCGDGALSGGAVIGLHNRSGGGSAYWSHDMHVAGFPLTLTAGFDYQRLREHRKGFVNADGREGALERNEDDTSSRRGEYAQARWTLGHWQLNGGVRQSRVRFHVDDHFITALNPDDSGRRGFTRNTGFASVLYKLTRSLNVYVSYGKGFQTPTLAELAYRPNATSGLNFQLAPSTSRNYEAGLKADFGQRGKLRLAVYRIDTDNEIVTAQSVNGRSTFRNAGTTTRKGMELSVGGGLGHGLHGYLAWTWLEAAYASGPFAGNRLPGVPRKTLYAALNWTYAPLGFKALADAQFRSQVFANDPNTAAASSYAVANLQAQFHQQVADWRFKEFVQLNNLFDRRYIGAVVVNAGFGRFFEPAPGRNYLVGVSARYSF